MKLLLRVALYPVLIIFDTPKRIKNWIRIKILRLSDRYVLFGNLQTGIDFAIVAVYPGTTSYASVLRSLNIFRDLDYQVLVVVNLNEKTPEWVERFVNQGFNVIQRPNIGADFGAYKLGIKVLAKSGILDSIQTLILMNDSIYVTPASASVIQSIAQQGAKSNCIFVHNQGTSHAASMLLKFNQEVIRNKTFREFWKKYYPYSNKKKTIIKGEHELTKTIGLQAFHPYVSTNLLKVDQDVRSFLNQDWLQALAWSIRSEKQAYYYLKSCLEMGEASRAVEYIFTNLQISNSCGLYLSREHNLPIKMDLTSLALVSESDFIKILVEQGCETQEIEEVEEILSKKHSYFTSSILDRISRG
jgi:hypothetical protein